MNFDQYSTAVATTAVYPCASTGTIDALVYVCLGLVGEATEVLEKTLARDTPGVANELGDVSWYLARLHAELGVPLADSFENLDDTRIGDATWLVITAGRIAENAKKALRDDSGTLTPSRTATLLTLLPALARTWAGVHGAHGLRMADTLVANAAKLADRRDRGVLTGSGDHR